MKVKIWMTCFGLALIVGCGKAKDETAASASPAVQTKSRPAPEGSGQAFSAEVEALPEPNAYRVHLRWPALTHSETWIVQRQEGAQLKTIGRFDGDTAEAIDTSVVAGATYRYLLSASEQSAWHPTDGIDVAIPRDTEISGVVAARDLQTKRLYLRAGSVLRLEDRTVKIDADEIIAEGGVIETFAAGQQAAAGQAGRSGGKLMLNARTGRGTLAVQLRGENGGVGRDGDAGSVGSRGADGVNGESREIVRDRWDIIAHPYDQAKICTRAPQPGMVGSLGGPGGNGIAGGRGGDTGSLVVKIDQPGGLQLLPVFTPGKGGIGRGGEGGVRGPNGNDGQIDPMHVCPPAVSPAPGTGRGARGQDAIAPDGAIGIYCAQLAGAYLGSCDLNK